jgi:hypothetical protein
MRLLVGLLSYCVAVAAIGSAVAALLYLVVEPAARTTARQGNPATASPRIQAWLERKAEGVAFAEKQKVEAQAERERADELRAKLAAAPEQYVAPRAQASEDRRGSERARAARARQKTNEARRQLRQVQTGAIYGYAAEPRWAAYPDAFLTQRDRYGY